MNKVVIHLYAEGDTFGVLLNPNNTIKADNSISKCIADYANTIDEYKSRNDITWATSLSLFKIVMESSVAVIAVDGDEFLKMMNKRTHYVKKVGNQACPLSISELTIEEIEPYLKDCISLKTGEPMEWNLNAD